MHDSARCRGVWSGCSAPAIAALVACGRHEPVPPPVGAVDVTGAAETRGAPDATSSLPLSVPQSVRTTCTLPDEPLEAPRFDLEGTELRPRGKDILRDVAVCLTRGALAGRSICITGYADSLGPSDENYRLGLARAEAVLRYLERFGVDRGRASVASLGEERARGSDPSSRALDRRVEIDVADAPGSPCAGGAAGTLRNRAR